MKAPTGTATATTRLQPGTSAHIAAFLVTKLETTTTEATTYAAAILEYLAANHLKITDAPAYCSVCGEAATEAGRAWRRDREPLAVEVAGQMRAEAKERGVAFRRELEAAGK
jgi:hypothetical protein